MSFDADKYHRIAEEEGEAHLYTDERLLRIWAALETLIPRVLTETCPQLLLFNSAENLYNFSAKPVQSQDKEASL